ncbi:MAG TPA: carboxypeptidase-like regulatory domain-containing protein, partial [Pyrinomonadaceae bacterium]
MNNRKKFSRGIVSLLLCVLLLSPLTSVRGQQAQPQSGRGVVTGTVTDASGASVAEAQVFLVGVQQAVLSTTQTDAGGRFNFADVAAGTYELRITRRGFDNRRLPARVLTGETTEVAVTLEVNALAEQITVTA